MVGEKGAVSSRAVLVGATAGVVVLVAVAGFLLRGNGSDGGEPVVTRTAQASPSASATPSATPSATTPTLAVPVLPRAATRPTRAGAEAFMRYFFEVYNHTYRSLDSSLLDGLSLAGCDFCAGVRANATAAKDAGQTIEGGAISVREAVAAPGKPEQGLVVNALIDQEPLVTKDRTGQVVDRGEKVDDVRVDARVVWTGSEWKVRAVRVVKSAG